VRTFFNDGRRAALSAAPTRDPLQFHRRLPGYEPTPLVEAPGTAAGLGLEGLIVKVESKRLGLPSFKILGASWGVYRALDEHVGGLPAWGDLDELRRALDPYRPLALAAATDGNHGRAVARMAALLGFGARIFVPAGTAAARIDAIVGEGASCDVVEGTYDDAVARAAEEASGNCLVISDTS
jgi:diaminopropionate ammonia-lyase